MKHLIWLLVVTVGLVACSKSGEQVTIRGNYSHLDQGQFFLFSNNPAWSSFDTVRVEEGEFIFTHTLTDTVLLTMQYPNFLQMTLIATPGKTLRIKGDANNLLTTKVEGDEENKLLTQFRHSVIGKTPADEVALAEKFIRKHPETFAAQAVLIKYFVDVKQIDVSKTKKLFALLQKAAPQRTSLHYLGARLGPLLQVENGKKLPRFKTSTLDGKTLHSDSLKEKPLLISFWSTWSPEFVKDIAAQQKPLRPFKKKLHMVNICLDVDSAQCISYIQRDSIDGYNVCDRKAWNSPLVRALGVRYLPSNILVDKRGKVVGRDFDQASLIAEIERLTKN